MVKAGMKYLVSDMYANRESTANGKVISELPIGAKACLMYGSLRGAR
jgi:hypothetical protein